MKIRNERSGKMKRAELIKGLSYRGKGVNVAKGKPVLVDDETAGKLLRTGFFRISDIGRQEKNERLGGGSPEKEPGKAKEMSENDYHAVALEKMKTAELEDYANSHEIDISACRTNKERIDLIKAVLSHDGAGNPEKEPGKVEEVSGKDNAELDFSESDVL